MVAINAIHLDRMPQFDYDRLLWGERQIRSVANMTRADARDFLDKPRRLSCAPRSRPSPLTRPTRRSWLVKNDAIDERPKSSHKPLIRAVN